MKQISWSCQNKNKKTQFKFASIIVNIIFANKLLVLISVKYYIFVTTKDVDDIDWFYTTLKSLDCSTLCLL